MNYLLKKTVEKWIKNCDYQLATPPQQGTVCSQSISLLKEAQGLFSILLDKEKNKLKFARFCFYLAILGVGWTLYLIDYRLTLFYAFFGIGFFSFFGIMYEVLHEVLNSNETN